MKYARFEDLPVWNDAIDLKLLIDQFCVHPGVTPQRRLVEQIDAASLSISNNIAEGFERGTTDELIYFLYVSRGSAGEVRSMLRYQERRPDLAGITSVISQMIERCISIARQIRGWADSLQNTDIKGPRHLTDQSRAYYEQSKRARAFWEKIRAEHLARFGKNPSEQQGGVPKQDPNDTVPKDIPSDQSREGIPIDQVSKEIPTDESEI
jgi:four helix bundle protein